MIDLSDKKLELDYPCSWEYKLVVLEHIDIHFTVKEVILDRVHKVKESKVSSKGKYKSYSLELLAKPPNAAQLKGLGLTLKDYEQEPIEIWPENWPSWLLFRNHGTQWRTGMGGPTGLDYGPVYAALARMGLSDEDHDCMFADVQHMEYAALAQMNKDRTDER